MSQAFVIFVFWPGVVVACGLVNMLCSWAFSWSELVFDYLIGVVAGAFLWLGVHTPGEAESIFFVFSHGVIALLYETSDGFKQNFATPEKFFWVLAGIRLGSVAWAGLLDRAAVAIGVGGVWATLFSFLLAPVKLATASITGSVGFLVWIVGAIKALVNRAQKQENNPDGTPAAAPAEVYFAAGTFITEFAPGPRDPYATTFGWVIHTWYGNCPLAHELYHTRQYIYMGDWLMPFWVLGCGWGAISGVIAGSPPKGFMDQVVIGSEHGSLSVGNPIEIAAHQIG